MKKKKKKNTVQKQIPVTNTAVTETTDRDGICEDISEIPESLAEELCEAIEEAKDKEEERKDKNKDKPEMTSLRNVLIAVAFGIVLFRALEHIGGIFAFTGSILNIFSPIIIGGCIAFVLNLVLMPVERLWGMCFSGLCAKDEKSLASRIASRLKRPVCLILSTLIMFGLVLGLFLIVIPELGVTARMFTEMIPEAAKKIEQAVFNASAVLEKYGIDLPVLKLDIKSVTDFLNSFITNRGQQMLNTTVGFTASLFTTVFDFLLSLVFAFYVLAQKEKLGVKMKRILYALVDRDKADTVVNIAALSNSTFARFVAGQFTEAVIIGVLCYIGMLILRLPYAAVISVVIGATAIIPMFGAFIGAAVGALLILGVNFMQAVWFVIFIILLQQVETNLIYPRVVGKSIGLPGILVLTAVTVGGAVFGFAGIILGVPICSVIYCIFNEFVAMRLKNKGIEREKTENGK